MLSISMYVFRLEIVIFGIIVIFENKMNWYPKLLSWYFSGLLEERIGIFRKIDVFWQCWVQVWVGLNKGNLVKILGSVDMYMSFLWVFIIKGQPELRHGWPLIDSKQHQRQENASMTHGLNHLMRRLWVRGGRSVSQEM